jgi:hypothetical protein
VINDLDETIKQILIEGVPVDISEVDVAFDAPTKDWSGALARPTINCFLYHMVENHDLRNTDWEMDRSNPVRMNGSSVAHSATRRRLPTRIDLHYMLTAWANVIEDEHRLLWRILASFMRYRVIPEEKLQGSLKEQEWPIPVKVAQPDGPFKNPADLWSSLETFVKPGVTLVVTLPLDPDQLVGVPLVLTRRILVHPGIADASPYELSTSQIGGWVLEDSGGVATPMAEVQVLVVERGLSAITDAQGRFKFLQVPHGSYTLRAVAPGGITERRIEVPGDGYDVIVAGETGKEEISSEKGGGRSTEGPGSRSAGKSRRR